MGNCMLKEQGSKGTHEVAKFARLGGYDVIQRNALRLRKCQTQEIEMIQGNAIAEARVVKL